MGKKTKAMNKGLHSNSRITAPFLSPLLSSLERATFDLQVVVSLAAVLQNEQLDKDKNELLEWGHVAKPYLAVGHFCVSRRRLSKCQRVRRRL
jgi:hypothetical protein